jgi:CSLREA domain-containing protein
LLVLAFAASVLVMVRGRAAGARFTWPEGLTRVFGGRAASTSLPLSPAPPVVTTRTVCPAGCDYATLTAAFADLTTNGVSTTMVLELQATYVSTGETYPITIANISGNSATNTITVVPALGATNLSISSANTTATIDLNGAANIIFDGRPGATGSVKQLTVADTSTATGGTAVRFINEASNNTIRYTTLKSNFPSPTVGVVTFSTTTGANGNDNNTIDNCDIDGGAGATASPTSGVAQNGMFSLGTTTTVARNNSGNTISNNNIFNNFVTGVAATSAGILLGVGNTDWTISGNSIYQTATRTATVGAATVYGISIANTASGNNFVVSGNFIGGSAASAGGSAWTINGAFANRFNAIGLNVATTTASSVQGNTIANFSFLTTSTANANSTSSPLGTGAWGGIYIAAGKANVGTITGNIIGSGTGTGSILVTGQTNPGATANGLGVSSADTVNISNNTVGSITTSGASGTLSTGIIGINSNAVGAIVVNNNTIGSTTTANSLNASLASTGTTAQVVIGIKNTGGSSFSITNNTIANLNNAYVPSTANGNNILSGISTSNGLVTITGNTVRNLSTAANGNGVGSASSVQGIQNTSTIDPLTITGNTIRSIANNNTTGATVVLGIYNAGQFTGTNIIARNFVHSLTNLSTAGFMNGIDVPGGAATYRNNMIVLGNGLTNAVLIDGINETGGTNNFYHNSIYIGGANVVSGSTPTNAFTSITTGTRNYRDNIFVNARSNTSGTGKHYGVRYGGASPNPSGLTTNNNIYLASGAGGVFGFFNSADRANLAAWQSATGQDANSFEADPQYLDPANATTPNLHINPTVATLVEGSGADVGVTDDFDTDIRANFTPVDIGADAGNFTSGGDFAPPVISYTTLPNTASTSNRTLTISVTDFSGVPTSGAGLPRLYFRKGASGGFATTQCTFVSGSSYSCTFDYSLVAGASVAVGDAVQYYVVAQDAAPTPNVAANPSAGAAGFSASPPAVSTPPTTPNSYLITGAFTGIYTVCDGGTYATLKSFFDAVNGGVVTGNITVAILGPCSEAATASLNQWLEEPAGSNFTMLIQPAGGARTITGTINGALIKLNGADRVTIEGLNTGANSLSLTNTNTSGTGIWLASLGLGAGATNNTIRSITITGNSTNTSGSGVDVSGSSISSPGADNDGNTVQGNTITKFGSGISVNGSGTVSAGGVDGLLVANNIVGPATAGANNILSTGIVISNAVAPSITGNTVRNVVSTSVGSPTEGIGLLFVTNAVVTRNTVSNISTSGSSAFAFGIVVHEGSTGAQVTGNKITGIITTDAAGQSAKGIYVNTETTASNVTVANNVVSDIQSASGTGTDFLRQPVGIYLDGATGGINLYHNSVNLFGSHAGVATASLQAALYVNSGVTAIDLRDNIFANSYDNSSSATDKSYAIYSRAPASSFTTINYNDYYASGPTGVLGFLASDRADIAAWRTATGQDVNSLAGDPQFASTVDLHIKRTSPSALSPVENVGISIGGITTDFDNDTRANPPDIGADEVTAMGFQSAVFVSPENGGNSFNTITVTRTAGSGNAASVNYATSDGSATGGGTCAAGVDYITTSGTLNFSAGQTSKTFQITLCDDAVYEGTEDINLTLSSPVGSIIGPFNPAVFSITDNESAPETDVAVSGGNLVIGDSNGGTTDDTLTISLVAGPNIRIHDPSHTLSAGAGAGQVDPNTVDVPLGSVTGNIQVNTLAGNDILTLDLSGGDFIPNAGLTFNGGNPTTGPGDKLILTGGSQGTVTYNYTNAHDGSILMESFGTVNYTGLEPITNSGTATDIVFNLPAGPNAATLADDGTSGNTLSRLSAATIETTDFANPTGSLTINRGNAGDTLAVNALPDFNASLTLGSVGSEFNTITFNGGVTLAANKNLSGNASGTINLSNGTSALTTSGAGTISLAGANVTGSGNISTGGGLTVSTSGTDSTLNTLSGVISGSGGLTILSSNALAFNSVALTGANTYTGVTTLSGNGRPVEVKAGSLADGGLPSAIGASSNAAANLVFAGISMFTYTGSATSTDRLFTLSGPSDFSLEIISNGTGELAFTNPGALVFGGSGNVSFVIYGTNNGSFAPVIGNRTGGVTNLSKSDDDTWTLSGANTYTGATDIEMGTLNVSLLADGGVASNIGASTNAAPNLSVRGTLKYTGSGANTDRLFKLGSDGGAIDSSGTGALNFTNTNAIDTDDLNTANAAFTLAGTNTDANTFAPKVNDGASAKIVPLTKSGVGAWNLSSVNTYTGATSVNAGRLNINGSITSNVTIANTSTLGGTGTINSANTVTVQSGGTVAPGTSPGILNTGNVTFDSSSTFAVEINGTTAGSGYDQLNVTGTVSLSDAILSLTGSHNPSEGEQFIIVNNDGSEAITGEFNTLPEGTIIPNFLGSDFGAQITYAGGLNSNDVVLTVVAAEVSVAVAPASVLEDGATNLDYTFTRSGNTTGTLTVNFTVGGAASFGTDYGQSGAASYTATTGSVTFTGTNATAVVTIDPTPDSSVEADETVVLTLAPGSGYTIASSPNASATGEITNDDETLVVNSAADPGDGPCTTDPGGCTLREAINAANLSSYITINFDIPGSGVQTISPLTPLPAIASPTKIDAYTQSGASPNTDPIGDNAVLMIELSGANVVVPVGDPPADGFVLSGGLAVIQGFVINRFGGAGIRISSPANEISGNFIGTDATGTSAGAARAFGNQVGVLIDDGFLNEVGCTFAEMRNVISGNHEDGVKIVDPATFNDVQGNFIGTDKTGLLIFDTNTQPLGNGDAGVAIYDSSDNLIGGQVGFGGTERANLDGIAPPEFGTTPSDPSNIIGGNRDGVEITSGISGAIRNLVHGNFIGTDYTRAAKLGNTRDGVRLGQDAALNEIGCDDLDLGNVITNNTGCGVNLLATASTGNLIGHNSIFANGGLGIDLGNDGVTPNDALDADPVPSPSPGPTPVAPNNYQNFPVLASAVTENDTTINGSLDSRPETEFVIEFFYSDAKDPSGNGEGQVFLDTWTVTTDANGHYDLVDFNPNTPVPAGKWITATATDPDGNTSEFSNAVQVGSLSVNKTGPSSPLTIGQTSTYTITVTNNDTSNDVASATVQELIPADLDLITATGTNWICSALVAQVTTCTFSGGTIDADGGTSQIEIVVQPKAGTAGNSVTNKYSVDPSGGTNPPDPSTCTAADAPNLGCGKPVGPDTIAAAAVSCPGTFTVNTNGDAVDAGLGDGACDTDSGTPGYQCSLRAAIEEANILTTCGPIEINFSGVASPISLLTSLPAISHDININGPGANVLTVQRGSATEFRIFEIRPGRTVAISNLTIANGLVSGVYPANVGGGIYNDHGTLSVTACIISGNKATGGAIFNNGQAGTASLTITNSSIRDNTATESGGGIYNLSGITTITASTVSDNSAVQFGGGIFNSVGGLTLINTTISGNKSQLNGGGIYNYSGGNPSTTTAINVTVTNNRADTNDDTLGDGGGIFIEGGNVLLHNTIVARNFKGASPSTTAHDVAGTLDSSSSYNLIGDGTGITNVGTLPANNQIGTTGSPIDPLLGTLQNNGGPTFTHGLLYNSPAVNKGDNAVTGSPLLLATDQRGQGFDRKADGDLPGGVIDVDIGAYERQATESRDVSDGSSIQINLVDVTLTFPCVNCGAAKANGGRAQTSPGLRPAGASSASITVIDPAAQPTPPMGYVIGNDSSPPLPAFDLSTTASVDPPIGVCFYLPSINDAGFFSGLKVLHNEDGTLVDRTTGQDYATRILCASVNSLSPFVIAHTATPTAANGNVSGQILDSNGHPVEGAGIRMSGTQTRLTVTDANGNYRFENVETNGFYTVVPSRANYSFSPSQRSFSALGQQTDAAFSASTAGNSLNPLDTTEYFVRQQYLDFLGRETDEAGLNFWYRNIEGCGDNANCRTAKRIDTSAAFFLSIEFQQTGYLVYRTYKTAYGDMPGAPVPLRLNEFKPDTAAIGNGVIVNKNGWENQLEQNKQAFMSEFVQRPRFVTVYPLTMTPVEFVDHLFVNARVSPSTEARSLAIGEFGSDANSSDAAARGRALRRVAENSVLTRQEFNQAFVLMQYFGNLRRDANAGQDTDFSGYNFWLNKLNTFNGNFGDAEMVKAFLVSGEYRGRFPR